MNAKQLAIKTEKLTLLSQWPSSGLTTVEFCKKHGLATHQFYYWLKRLRQNSKQEEKTTSNNFIPVKVSNRTPSNNPGPVLELVFPNGKQLKFYSAVNFAELRTLIG